MIAEGTEELDGIDLPLPHDDERIERLDTMGRTAIKLAAAAVVATSLASALAEPPHTELMSLPTPTPIVRIYQPFDEDIVPDEDEQEDESSSRWRRLLKALKYLLVALALVASLALGLLKGCAGIAGGLLLPPAEDEQQQEEQAHASQTSDAEDERGVAY